MNETNSARPEGADTETAPRHLSRRQMLRAGAWAAPVILLATAAPAAVASGPTTPEGTTGELVYMDNFSENGVREEWSAAEDATVFVSMDGTVNFRADYTVAKPITSTTLTLTMDANGLAQPLKAEVLGGRGWSLATSSVKNGVASFTFLWAGTVAGSATSDDLKWRVHGSRCKRSAAFAKTVNGVLAGPQVRTVAKSVTFA